MYVALPRYRRRYILLIVVYSTSNGVGTNFARRGEVRRAESGGWGSWRGATSPSPPTRGLGERCEVSQRGLGRSPGRRRVFLYSEPSDCLSFIHSFICISVVCVAYSLHGQVLGFSRGIHINIPT